MKTVTDVIVTGGEVTQKKPQFSEIGSVAAMFDVASGQRCFVSLGALQRTSLTRGLIPWFQQSIRHARHRAPTPRDRFKVPSLITESLNPGFPPGALRTLIFSVLAWLSGSHLATTCMACAQVCVLKIPLSRGTKRTANILGVPLFGFT